MPEHRARKHHQDRVAETLKEEIGAMIEGELSDPRIDLCHISEVALNPGAKSARIYVVVDSNAADMDKAEKQTIAGLEAAKGYVRHQLKESLDRSSRYRAVGPRPRAHPPNSLTQIQRTIISEIQ
ncbi:MAG: ribosome-binding factor A [Terracidiphilus sp.]